MAKDNVVLSLFSVESEAFQALTELRQHPGGEGYAVAEAALVKNENGEMKVLDGFDISPTKTDDTAAGILIGSLAGILAGPWGVLLGASYGALVGAMVDTDDTVNEMTALELLASKTYAGEVAIIALVREEEPAFDAALKQFDTTILRYDSAAIASEVDRAYQLQDEAMRQAHAKFRADRKVDLKSRHEERKAKIKAHFDELGDKLNS